ncbi:substrate-binding domain-containing protein [Gryllotalpicola reticulitermitis]|uniref:Substrate-binding domain-containing protein n=1 Tax=Gryllotalpicola reticulitermitis TaxID=1184153 RepID=A0ABV8QA47_9MICO
MKAPTRPRMKRLFLAIAASLGFALAAGAAIPANAAAQYVTIAGEGSSWAGLAWNQWEVDAAQDGVTFNYTPNGSSTGRDDFAKQVSAAFADSEIPFTGDADDPQDAGTPDFSYAMLPVVAGGTSFAYNLPIGGSSFTKLQLNMATIAGIFSGEITKWNAPPIAATNKGVALPNQQITVVVRSDGSGATAQFKLWMLRQYPSDYKHLAVETGGDPTHASSYYQVGSLGKCAAGGPCFIAQSGSDGVTTFTSHNPYSIDYDEYAYALRANMPVARVENGAGYFTLPTADAVAVALTQAKINTDKNSVNYLSQDLSDVYGYKDPRSYPMSMYTYEMIPTQTTTPLGKPQGATLAWISTNAVCSWRADMGALGYSPLPMNLVLASMQQIQRTPGIDAATSKTISTTQSGVTSGASNPCNSPTFKPGDSITSNELVKTAPFPVTCDATCQAPWRGKDSDASVPQAAGSQTGTGSGGGAAAGNNASPSTTGAGAGTSGGGTGGGTAPKTNPVTAGTSTTAGAQTSCDPNTGVCSTGSTNDTANAADVKAVPTVIAEASGPSAPLALLLIAALVALLLIGPPIVSAISARSRSRG